MEIIFIIFSILSLQDEHVKNFLKTSSQFGLPKYEFVKKVKCNSGPTDTSYVLAPTGEVFLKQYSIEGDLGKTCKKS